MSSIMMEAEGVCGNKETTDLFIRNIILLKMMIFRSALSMSMSFKPYIYGINIEIVSPTAWLL